MLTAMTLRRSLALATLTLAACGAPSPAPGTPATMPTGQCGAGRALPAARTLRFDVVMTMGLKAGEHVVTVHPNGDRAATLEWNDRGRGPKLSTHLETDAEGLPKALEVLGVDYFKVPVDERLARKDGRLVWKSRAESGDADASGRAFYVPFEGVPELDAALARALLRRADHAAPLLPTGTARLEKGTDLVLGEGENKLHITRWDFLGVGLMPEPIWLDDDGELVAEASEWQSVIRKGWSQHLPTLLADQNAAQSTYLARQAKALAHTPPAAGLALVNARIFDVEKKAATMGTIVIKDGRVAAVGAASAVKVPAGAETLDVAGKTVLPGLWDMHTHVQATAGPMHIAAGVTTVRDLGNAPEIVLRLRKSWDAGETVGPRVIPAGFIDGSGPFQGPIKVFADTEDEARAQVAKYASLGYEQIKIYSSMKPALVPVIIAEAHARKMRVSGHIPMGLIAADAVNAGFDEIQHMNFVFLNFLATRDEDTRTPLRFMRVAEKGGTLDPGSPQVKELIKLFVQKKTVIDPTDNVFEGMFTSRAGAIPEWATAIAPRLPVMVRRSLLGGGLDLPDPGADARYRASFERVLAMTKALYDAGVTLVAGTDAWAGLALHRELELYARAGIPPAEVLALATLGAARVMKRDKELGSIAVGKVADLAIYDGKPDVDMRDIEKTATTLRGGVVYASKDVFASVGIGP